MICAISCYFYFYFVLMLPMHAVNMRRCVYEFTLQILYICWGAHLCCLWYYTLRWWCFGMWFVVHDVAKWEEMNRKMSEKAQKTHTHKKAKTITAHKNELDVDAWMTNSVCALSSIMYKLWLSYIRHVYILAHTYTLWINIFFWIWHTNQATTNTLIHDLCCLWFKSFPTTTHINSTLSIEYVRACLHSHTRTEIHMSSCSYP